MPFDPKNYLLLATSLVTAPAAVDEQSRFRSAISRSYYAALLRLKQRIEEHLGPGSVPTEGTHSAVLRALRQTRATHLEAIRKKLETMQEERNDADYELTIDDLRQDQVEVVIERADRLISSIDAVNPSLLSNLKF